MVRRRNQRSRRSTRRLPSHADQPTVTLRNRRRRGRSGLARAGGPGQAGTGQAGTGQVGAGQVGAGQVGAGASGEPPDLVVVLPDQGVALVVVETQALGQAPGCGAFQMRQGQQVTGPAQPAQRQVILPPAQHGPGPGVQVGDRQRRAVQRAGRGQRGQRDEGQVGGGPDGGQRRPADRGRVQSGPAQEVGDLGRALIEQRDEQVLGGGGLVPGGGQRRGGLLGLHVQVARAPASQAVASQAVAAKPSPAKPSPPSRRQPRHRQPSRRPLRRPPAGCVPIRGRAPWRQARVLRRSRPGTRLGRSGGRARARKERRAGSPPGTGRRAARRRPHQHANRRRVRTLLGGGGTWRLGGRVSGRLSLGELPVQAGRRVDR